MIPPPYPPRPAAPPPPPKRKQVQPPKILMIPQKLACNTHIVIQHCFITQYSYQIVRPHIYIYFFKILLKNTKIQCTYTQTSSAMVLNHRAEFYFPVQGLRIAIDRLEEICGKIDRRFQGVRKSSASFITAEGRRGVSYYLLYLSRSNGFRRFIIFSLTIWVFSRLSSLFILL